MVCRSFAGTLMLALLPAASAGAAVGAAEYDNGLELVMERLISHAEVADPFRPTENIQEDLLNEQPLVLALSCCYQRPPEVEEPSPERSTADAPEFHASFALSPQNTVENSSSPYRVSQARAPANTSRNDIELRARAAGINAHGVLRQELADGSHPEYHGVANQLYYDGQITSGIGWTVGKKVMTWGVGFGFKPLDVIQREDRRTVNPAPLVGIPLVALDVFSATDAWSLVWSNPTGSSAETDTKDPGLALRWYRLTDGDDLYGLVRISERRKLEVGAGITHVIGDTWSIYGAALYQRRTWRRVNTLLDGNGILADADPMLDRNEGDGVKASIGAQWTDANGMSVLTEAWYDGDAYSKRDWQALAALTTQQRALPNYVPAYVKEGNVAWSSQAYLSRNLLRENILMRVSYDDSNGFKPYAELLATPSDGGLVFTAGAKWERNRQSFEVGLRQVGGKSDSAYEQAPNRRVVWAAWCFALF